MSVLPLHADLLGDAADRVGDALEPEEARRLALGGVLLAQLPNLRADVREVGVRQHAVDLGHGLLHLLASDRTGHYLHVDEFDAAVAAGYPDAALKPIDELAFEAPAEATDVDTFAWAQAEVPG